jgi:hypothetical protein
MWKCKGCGEVHEDIFDSCWKCGAAIDSDPSPQPDFAVDDDTDQEIIIFSCVICKRKLRIPLPIGEGFYICPACKTHYKPIKSDDTPYILVLVPQMRNEQKTETPPPKRPRVIPREVKSALAVFDLAENATFEEIKPAYRRAVHQYHPDKVTHLGSELKKVAEQKTREFVAAFEILKKYFSENEE